MSRSFSRSTPLYVNLRNVLLFLITGAASTFNKLVIKFDIHKFFNTKQGCFIKYQAFTH